MKDVDSTHSQSHLGEASRAAALANDAYFLGGYDLEMVTIRDWLMQLGARLYDRRLAWGAKSSAYAEELAAELQVGRRVVLIELEDDLELGQRAAVGQAVWIDHHGSRSGRNAPTALRQVFELLDGRPSEWTRWFDLVDANDRGHIPALLERGATTEELLAVRAADRAAQGISAVEEQAGREAAMRAELQEGGRWTLVRLPHGRTTVAADYMNKSLGGPGFENLLVLWSTGQHFLGDGRVVLGLESRFPGGYYGGDLPFRGYWGHPRKLCESTVHDVIQSLVDELE